MQRMENICNNGLNNEQHSRCLNAYMAKGAINMVSEVDINAWNLTLLLTVMAAFFWIYWHYTSQFSFWKIRGMQYATPLPVFGNITEVIFMRKSYFHVLEDLYEKFAGLRYFGMYRLNVPYLVIRDPTIMRDILVDHFDSFSNRGMEEVTDIDPLCETVFTLDGNAWKTIRKGLCGVFSKEKDARAFEISLKCAKRITGSLWDPSIKHKDVNVREIFVRFFTDVAGLYILGLELNSVEDFTSTVRELYYIMCSTSWKAKLSQICWIFFPRLWKFFKLLEENRTEEFIVGFTKAVMQYRRENLVIRDDLLQLFMQLQNHNLNYKYSALNGRIKNSQSTNEDKYLEVSNTLIAAHVLDFIVSGPEILSIYLSVCVHELALNEDVQNKVRNELDTVIRQCGGKFTHETIRRLKYMDQVLNETLRKYNMWHCERICTKPYPIPGSSTMLEKGDRIVFPIHAYYNDPNFFPNPELFDPERFNENNLSLNPQFTFVPFGEGPRNCICKDYCIIQFKVALATLLLHYKVKLCSKSIVPLPMESTAFAKVPSKGVWLRIERRA